MPNPFDRDRWEQEVFERWAGAFERLAQTQKECSCPRENHNDYGTSGSTCLVCNGRIS